MHEISTVFLPAITFNMIANGQATQLKDPNLYKAGYQNILLTDSNRLYKPTAKTGDKLYFRPLEIDVWYPAENTVAAQPMQYGELLNTSHNRILFSSFILTNNINRLSMLKMIAV